MIKTENKEIDNLYRKISKLTDLNDHNQSVLELAKFLHITRMDTIIRHVMGIHLNLGYMPSQLISFRSEILNTLLKELEDRYGIEAMNKIKGAF